MAWLKKKTETGDVGVKIKPFNKKGFIQAAFIVYLVLLFLVCHIGALVHKGVNFLDATSLLTQHILSSPFDLYISLEMWFLGTLLYAMFMYTTYTKKKRRHKDIKGIEKGSANWVTDYDDYNERNTAPFGKPHHNSFDNIIYSKNVHLALDHRRHYKNNNSLIFGGSGSGKSRGVVKPNMCQAYCSYVITDIKGELLKSHGHFLRQKGYEVRVFNLNENCMDMSDGYNPFRYLHSIEHVVSLVDAIMDTTKGKDDKEDVFSENAKALLKCIISYLYFRGKPEDQTMSQVLNMVVDSVTKAGESPCLLQRKMDEEHRLYKSSYSYDNYKSFRSGPERFLASVVALASSRLNAFTVPAIKKMTTIDTIHLDEFGTKRIALFLELPIGGGPFANVGAMMITQLFDCMLHRAKSESGNWYCLHNVKDMGKGNFEKGQFLDYFLSEKEVEEYKEKMAQAEIVVNEDTSCSLVYTEDNKSEVLKTYSTIKQLKNATKEEIEKEEERAIENNKDLLKQWKKMYKSSDLYTLDEPSLPEPVMVILDEYKNLSKAGIPLYKERLATIRSFNISTMTIYQSLGQLKEMYGPEGSEEVFDNCSCLMYLGGQAYDSAEQISKMMGVATAVVEGITVQPGKQQGSENYTASQRSLADPSEVMGMKFRECLVRIQYEGAFNELKYEYTEHPNYHLTGDADKSQQFIIDLEYKGHIDSLIPPEIIERDSEEINFIHEEKVYGKKSEDVTEGKMNEKGITAQNVNDKIKSKLSVKKRKLTWHEEVADTNTEEGVKLDPGMEFTI